MRYLPLILTATSSLHCIARSEFAGHVAFGVAGLLIAIAAAVVITVAGRKS